MTFTSTVQRHLSTAALTALCSTLECLWYGIGIKPGNRHALDALQFQGEINLTKLQLS